jgi:hypothetical protein
LLLIVDGMEAKRLLKRSKESRDCVCFVRCKITPRGRQVE